MCLGLSIDLLETKCLSILKQLFRKQIRRTFFVKLKVTPINIKLYHPLICVNLTTNLIQKVNDPIHISRKFLLLNLHKAGARLGKRVTF